MSQRPRPDDAWVEQHYPRLLRMAWLLTGNHSAAEDLTQDTLLNALESWQSFQGRSSESTWLISILLRLHRRRQRSMARLSSRIMRWWQSIGEHRTSIDPAVEFEKAQWKEGLWSRVSLLPIAQQQVIVLRYGEDMSYAEIGTILNCPEATARTRIHYGLDRLRLLVTSPCSTIPTTKEANSVADPLSQKLNFVQKTI